MSRDPRYDILFEPVKIGPVTARNRFYQVPHCNGMGHQHPSSMAAMRGIKAEGGWAVISTEECEIHPSTDVSPHIEARLWDDSDIPALARMTEAVHKHESLAAIELVYQGHETVNRYSREVPMGVGALVGGNLDPVQAYAMDKEDIRSLRRWHREAALRAKKAGFDIIYVYAGHQLSIPMHFISRQLNHRTDEYGGSIENRVRLFRELIEDAKDAVGDTCAIAVRFATDELLGDDGITADGDGRAVVEIIKDLPDLWDVNVSDWANDSVTSRFGPEGAQEPFIAFVKKITGKPVVGVGRFTSPDTMVSQIKRGIMDFIGAARPSIADPFLPKKIETGNIDDIRECIGCNICVSNDYTKTPIRCTQNPTMGEEWRRDWHPETIAEKKSEATILVVGAGPAGLECAHALGKRGYAVTLAEAGRDLGGRVLAESALPGLAAWKRVVDYRLGQITPMANVEIYRESRLDVDQVLELAPAHVVIATGSRWQRTGLGRNHRAPIPGGGGANVFTPDDIMAGRFPEGPVLVYDDDHYYMGGVMAEALRAKGLEVTLATPAPDVSTWTHNTLEQFRIQKHLLEMGVTIIPVHTLRTIGDGESTLACIFTGKTKSVPAQAVLLVTMRDAEDGLYQGLRARSEDMEGAGIKSVTRIGDALAPGTIAAAVYGGHRFARELDDPPQTGTPFRRELPRLAEQ